MFFIVSIFLHEHIIFETTNLSMNVDIRYLVIWLKTIYKSWDLNISCFQCHLQTQLHVIFHRNLQILYYVCFIAKNIVPPCPTMFEVLQYFMWWYQNNTMYMHVLYYCFVIRSCAFCTVFVLPALLTILITCPLCFYFPTHLSPCNRCAVCFSTS